MVFSVRRLSKPLGAEIMGIDLRQRINDAIKAELQQALLDHHFIVVPGQELADLQHKTFCEVFGEIQADRGTVPESESGEVAGMMQVSNFVENGIFPMVRCGFIRTNVISRRRANAHRLIPS